jgi:hypothetical protein
MTMNIEVVTSTLKGIGISAVAVAGAVAGYVNIQRDIAYVKDEVALHDEYIEKDKEISVRVDERTRIMKEQLDRIEKQVGK